MSFPPTFTSPLPTTTTLSCLIKYNVSTEKGRATCGLFSLYLLLPLENSAISQLSSYSMNVGICASVPGTVPSLEGPAIRFDQIYAQQKINNNT